MDAGSCQPLETGPTIEGIRIRQRLAVGGMAELFLADQTLPSGEVRPVVIKQPLPGADDGFLELLRRERAALSQVESPFVVRLLGGSDAVLVLEYVDGPDLAALLGHVQKRGRRLPLGAALAAVAGMLRGLGDLHRATDASGRPLGLVHRDVNPANVLVSRTGDVKLADLGVVHVGLAEQPTLGGLKGTLAYMAPEQLLGDPIDRRTDLYSAALVAWEALTGVPARPAGASGIAELLRARSTLPAPPSSLRPELPTALDEALLRALAPSPADRPESAEALLEALLSSAGVAPDPAALALAVAGVAPSVSRATRTLGPEPLRLASPEPSPPVPPSISRWRRPLLLASSATALGLAVLLAWPREAGVSIGAAAPTATEPRVHIERRPAEVLDAGPSLRAAPEAAVERTAPSPAVLAAPEDARRALEESARRPERRPEPPRAASAPPKVAAPLAAMRLEVRSAGEGPVHVAGAGASGLAPRRTDPLALGAHVLSLHGGVRALPAVLRVTRVGDRLTATIGAPAGTYYEVTCGGRALGPTPVSNVAVGDGIRCRLSAADGGAFAFALAAVHE